MVMKCAKLRAMMDVRTKTDQEVRAMFGRSALWTGDSRNDCEVRAMVVKKSRAMVDWDVRPMPEGLHEDGKFVRRLIRMFARRIRSSRDGRLGRSRDARRLREDGKFVRRLIRMFVR